MSESMNETYKNKAIELAKKAMDSEILALKVYHEFVLFGMQSSETHEELKKIFEIWEENRKK